MATNHFFGIDGQVYPCMYPEGRDPLLSRYRAGERGTHPRWTDPLFWSGTWTAAAADLRRSHAQYVRQKAKKATTQ